MEPRQGYTLKQLWGGLGVFVLEATEYSLDYVQVRNRLLLIWALLHWRTCTRFTNSFSNKYKLVKRPGKSHEGVGRKKTLKQLWKNSETAIGRKTSPSCEIRENNILAVSSTPSSWGHRKSPTSHVARKPASPSTWNACTKRRPTPECNTGAESYGRGARPVRK